MASKLFRFVLVAAAGVLVIAAAAGVGEAAKGSSSTLTLVAVEQPEGASVDLTKLPIGDGRISSSAQAGYLWSCQQTFVSGQGGAARTGDWFNATAGTFDITRKPVVDGAVKWQSSFTITVDGTTRVVSSNGLPSHATGVYPVAANDDAAQYDRNPNSISAQSLSYRLPANPAVAQNPSCAGGQVGVLLSGSPIFNAVDAGGRDAVAHELQDSCQGHPQQSGVYHYHNLTSCIADASAGHSKLMGYALDGFGIYGSHGEAGQEMTNATLDECHGHTHEVEWDGKTVSMFHYHATAEYPYTVGCFRGTATRAGQGGGTQTAQQTTQPSGTQQSGQPSGQQPSGLAQQQPMMPPPPRGPQQPNLPPPPGTQQGPAN